MNADTLSLIGKVNHTRIFYFYNGSNFRTLNQYFETLISNFFESIDLCIEKNITCITDANHSQKDVYFNVSSYTIDKFYGTWLIEETCNSVKLDSSHPINPGRAALGENADIFPHGKFFHIHECKNNEIAYFKVDVNLIQSSPWANLGLVLHNLMLKIS